MFNFLSNTSRISKICPINPKSNRAQRHINIPTFMTVVFSVNVVFSVKGFTL